MKQTSTYSAALFLCLAMSINGCALPIQPHAQNEPALEKIHQAFEYTIKAAHNSKTTHWTSGWVGNMQVNHFQDNHYGLCYHWKKLTYRGVLDTVHRVGWQASGIAINKGDKHEHHAVLVYDPKRVNVETLLDNPRQPSAYVLDAWRQGQADIYTLEDWLKLPWRVKVPAQLVKVKPDIDIDWPERPASLTIPVPSRSEGVKERRPDQHES